MTQVKINPAEQEIRLSNITDGPWKNSASLAKETIQPASSFATLVSRKDQILLADLSLQDSDRKKNDKLRTILRDHRKSPIVNAYEIDIRDSLDEAMTYFQLAELALRAGYIELNDDVRKLLRLELLHYIWSPAVREYLRTYGYFSIGRLSDLLGLKHEYPSLELPPTDDESIGYAGFLATVLDLYSDQAIDFWLGILDDYDQPGANTASELLSILEEASKHEFNHSLLNPRASLALAGMSRFFDVLSELFGGATQIDCMAYGTFFYYWLAKSIGVDRSGIVETSGTRWLQVYRSANKKNLKPDAFAYLDQKLKPLENTFRTCEEYLCLQLSKIKA